MKKLFIIISAFLMLALNVQAQETINRDRVVNLGGTLADTLNQDDTVINDFYVSKFAESVDVQFELDSLSGDPKVQILCQGSYDYQNWYEIVDSTHTMASDNFTLKGTERTCKYPYIRTKLTAVDNAQNSRYTIRLVIDKND